MVPVGESLAYNQACLHILEYPQIIVGLPAKEGCVRFGIGVKAAPQLTSPDPWPVEMHLALNRQGRSVN